MRKYYIPSDRYMFTIYFKLGNYGKNIKTFILPQTNFNEFLRLLKMKDTPDAQKSFLRRDLSTLMATINFKNPAIIVSVHQKWKKYWIKKYVFTWSYFKKSKRETNGDFSSSGSNQQQCDQQVFKIVVFSPDFRVLCTTSSWSL